MNLKDSNDRALDYELESFGFPPLRGWRLHRLVWLLESRWRFLFAAALLRRTGVVRLRRQPFSEPPTFLPIHSVDNAAPAGAAIPPSKWSKETAGHEAGFRFPSITDFARAYANGCVSPEDVAKAVISSIQASQKMSPALNAFLPIQVEDVLRQARESTQRFQAGNPRSPLEGVPVAIKDELDMVPYPTRGGTSFLGSAPALADATVVARLRAAGALLVGKTVMHEIGIGVTGLNLHHGTARNPYAPGHYTGGSSGGSAAAVAAGICPVALGADGGGSIRIPSAFCGLTGLKPTYGRISESGALPLCWSVAHIGPMAANVSDAVLAYAVIAGPDPKDPSTFHQPIPTVAGWNTPDLNGLTLGIYPEWFHHADSEVVSVCEGLLHQFEQRGARLQKIVIPDLEAARVAHAVTISSEMAQAVEYPRHTLDHGWDVRLNLAVTHHLTARDYIQAQRVRTRLLGHFRKVLQEVDAIVTPSTAIPAPPIRAEALRRGESDLATLTEVMRFTTPANLTGLPAVSFPAGYSRDGLPIGMQAIGRPWEESLLFRVSRNAESIVERKPPQINFEVLVPSRTGVI